MVVGSERLRSGVPDLDELLGGLILGDNIVWVTENPDVVRRLEDALLTEAVGRGQPCFYVTAGTAPDRLRERLHPAVTVLDARARGPLGNPALLERAILEGAGGSPPGCVVVDSLDRLARRWGGDRAVGFFSRVCPRLFDLGALAYWRAPRRELGSAFLERITRVTQCVLEASADHLRVIKAEGRPATVQGRLLRLELDDEELRLSDERALGRLGRGLERVRRERNLTQSDLARLLDVSPSAISQAEGGRRGLSLDTVVLLSERLGVSLDDLLSTAPESGYVLARRPRAPVPANSPLVDDPQAGLRAYLIRLGPGESGAPDIVHKGPELVLVASGLVQVTIGSDAPVMRSGDAALATRVAVSAWRNLTSEPAMVFWVLRD
ncbi:MAG TPA: helix-turn-helix domain-containing protein [Acidimicrobiales bacterium]|nr:helix-turn-helix domain-containing protein [Acidimicrobiales bacterium]